MRLETYFNPFWQAGAPCRVAIFLDGNARGALRFFAMRQRLDAAPDDTSGFPVYSISGAEGEAGAEAQTRTLREMVAALDAAGYPKEGRLRVFLPRVEGNRSPRAV